MLAAAKGYASKEIMQSIYELIQNDPEFYAWFFGVVNIGWGLFLYFNKQSHERKLKYLEQDLRFSADRRLKLFDLKASQYSQYVTDLDAFGKKNQVEVPAKMQPIFEKYLKEYMAAADSGDKDKEREVIGWLSSQITALMNEGLQDVMQLKYESNRLKLIATDAMIETFESIELMNQKLFDLTNEYMNNFTEIIIYNQSNKTEAFQLEAAKLGEDLQKYSKQLLSQMRQEINDI